MVKKKSTGCGGEHVFSRDSLYYPQAFPFMAWVGKSSRNYKDDRYVISYREDNESGDFYLREDFEPLNYIHLEDELFEI